MSESAELVERLRAEAARNEAGVKVFDGVPDVDQASDTMQCAADDLRAAADLIEKLEARVDDLEAELRRERMAAKIARDARDLADEIIANATRGATPASAPHQPPAPQPHDAAGDS